MGLSVDERPADPRVADPTGGDGAAVGRQAFERGFYFTITLLMTTLLVTLGAQLPGAASPGALAGQRSTYRVFWPQGWNFFATEPEDGYLVAYRLGADGAPVEITFPQMSAANDWGLSRTAYAQIPEVRQIAAQVPASDWVTCAAQPATPCLRAAAGLLPVDVTNEFGDPTLCGPLVILAEKWDAPGDRRGTAGAEVPERAASVDIQCVRAGAGT